MPFDRHADPMGYRILTGFGLGVDSSSTWRSTSGVARDCEIAHAKVVKFVTGHPEYFVRSDIQLGGVLLYKARPNIKVLP